MGLQHQRLIAKMPSPLLDLFAHNKHGINSKPGALSEVVDTPHPSINMFIHPFCSYGHSSVVKKAPMSVDIVDLTPYPPLYETRYQRFGTQGGALTCAKLRHCYARPLIPQQSVGHRWMVYEWHWAPRTSEISHYASIPTAK